VLFPQIKIELNIVRYGLIEQQKARERQGERTDLHPSNFRQTFAESDKSDDRKVDAIIGEKAGACQ
jgi:galactose-1-phosphate uridylyltransferase